VSITAPFIVCFAESRTRYEDCGERDVSTRQSSSSSGSSRSSRSKNSGSSNISSSSSSSIVVYCLCQVILKLHVIH
jgi:hypothetical protein